MQCKYVNNTLYSVKQSSTHNLHVTCKPVLVTMPVVAAAAVVGVDFFSDFLKDTTPPLP